MLDLEYAKVRKIHLVGICGIGMQGIARILASMKFEVSGSDLNSESNVSSQLRSKGIKVYHGHHKDHIRDVHLIVKSTAIPDNNQELNNAKSLKIPIMSRAQMISELMRIYCGIAISGTHGKTTTTSMIASIFTVMKKNPTCIIGGHIHSMDMKDHGSGRYMIAEADESDGSFLRLNPMLSVITNVDVDHLETYSNSFDELSNAFIDFINNIPFYGVAIVCSDGGWIEQNKHQISSPFITYGQEEGSDYLITSFNSHSRGVDFSFKKDKQSYNVSLNVPGYHNALNATASIAVANQCGIDIKDAISALKLFKGVKRRFDHQGQFNYRGHLVDIIEDYAHHPTEISATLDAARSMWPDRHLRVFFQPHRYSRLKSLWDDFRISLEKSDSLHVLPVYSAGESELDQVNHRTFAKYCHANAIEPEELCGLDISSNEVFMFLGAGNVNEMCYKLCLDLEKYCEYSS